MWRMATRMWAPSPRRSRQPRPSPTAVVIKITTIGYGSPNGDTAGVHGAPLGEEAELTRTIGMGLRPLRGPRRPMTSSARPLTVASLEADGTRPLPLTAPSTSPKRRIRTDAARRTTPGMGQGSPTHTPDDKGPATCMTSDLPGSPRTEPARTDRWLRRPHPLNYTDIKEMGSYQPETPEKRYRTCVRTAMAAASSSPITTAD